MIKIKYLLIAALLLTAASPVTAKSKQKKNIPQRVYMFGFAASFNDTIVHFTEIQAVDSAWLSSKKTFLLGRDNYSYQLRDYLTRQQMPYRTCVIFFDCKLSRLQKIFLKVKNKYSVGKKGMPTNNDIRIIPRDSFHFSPINMSDTSNGE